MRIPYLPPALGLVACLASASPSLSANPDFDITGTWAAEGKACSEAQLFVEFDGRDVLAYSGPAGKARVAADYSTAFAGDRLTVNLTKADSREGDEWRFILDGSNRMRLDSAFFAPAGTTGGLMKLTRCPRA
ncbi:hypothetical protein [Enterovirga aerilata]|uniref:Uncharacterized protein n=1 Tax=Enterovirga aerilata TaxID=2730920 RepID=A0A849I593_9HYPH|nr:hypothetical protein [Enterovirga sp. DB1703]NNM71505.1 hypothetical protein [Enterovirga sp. DB1703]